MYNAEKRGKKQVLIRPVSKVVIKFLQVMQRHGKSPAAVSGAPYASGVAARGLGDFRCAASQTGLGSDVPRPGAPPAAGYINDFELIDDHRAGKIVVELNGRINKCGCIRCVSGTPTAPDERRPGRS